ncbi:hypothetical protein [Desulfofalx alkaliphila]|uniref:hypothetical protein n=1 Tax=Desulfofalx alkaliphila TaxID=105483 RepID=UPI001A9A4CF7|nr:hypothetical protein [Desulfofalx alkaliphila]
MGIKRIIIICLTVLMLALPATAFGAETIIQVRPGLNGVYKMDQPVNLNISIANNGPAIEDGYLVVAEKRAFAGEESHRQVMYRQAVQVPAYQRIDTSIVIPWEMISGQAIVALYANGEEVASDLVQGMSVGGEMVAVTVGETPLAKGLPAWLETNRKHMLTMKYLDPNEVPTNPLALLAADLLMIDEQNVEYLSAEQVETIRHWVALGGTLILPKGAGAREGQPFADISPVLVTGDTTLAGHLNGLRKSTDAIPAAVGMLEKGRSKVIYDDIPLVAINDLGRGRVIYSALGFEHIEAQDTGLWEEIFDEEYFNYSVAHRGDMLHASAKLPQLEMPSIQLMIGVWGVYMLVVAPGLYWILRRSNRRGLAWFCIPAIAIIVAGVMYYTAPFHKLKAPLGNTLAVVEVLGEDVAEIRADGTYVSPRGENLLLTDKGLGLVVPNVRYAGFNIRPPVVENTGDGQLVNFTDIDFWSARQASTYKVANDFGTIISELELKDNKISGKLYNNTNTDLEDCIMVIGESVIELGNLKMGEEITVDSDLLNTRLFSWEWDLRENFPADVIMDHYTREAHYRFGYYQPGFAGAQLIGYTESLDGLMEIENGDNYLTAAVLQKLPLTFPESGKISLPPGIIPLQIVDFSGPMHHTPDGRYMTEGGDITIEYNLRLPSQYGNIDVTSVKLSNLNEYVGHKISVYNWKENQWEELSPPQVSLEGDDLKRYLSEHRRMQFRITHLERSSPVPILLPGLAVEGVVE